ncbi:hypothetical protein HYFRA_00008445 [Hymenoscyphus fraxineus]|uniref:Uncharacterized protein n=1 Tax=Hymenoscyphus fraxineus TaxID=746836 RepID=A0A9N9KNI5_9HELO|nr:hypothetical protein HYFRA_00008445 [Hymenoscyphus fraxineus]
MLLQGSTPTPLRAIAVQTPRHMESSSQDLELRPASGFTDSQLRELESIIANAVTQAVTTALWFQNPAPTPGQTDEPTYEAVFTAPTHQAVSTALYTKDPTPTPEPADKSASAPAHVQQRVLVTSLGYYNSRLDGKGDIVKWRDVWSRDVALWKGQDSVEGIG